MTLLLDTHLLLWAALGDSVLPSSVAELINEPTNDLVFSVANIWEIAIKSSLGRADFEVNPHILRTRLLENGYVEVPISGEHVLAVANLPNLHKDPFDRILVAQASVEGFTLLTVDPLVASYPGPIIKA
jgi:PIN domain nuclease of toxin-antitoxin system